MMNVPITTCIQGAQGEDRIHSNFPCIEWERHDPRQCTDEQTSNHRDHDDS